MTRRTEPRTACVGSIARQPPREERALTEQTVADAYPRGGDSLLFVVSLRLAAGAADCSDRELGRSYCALQTMAPLETDWQDNCLLCQVMCSASSPEHALWRTLRRVQTIAALPVLRVEVAERASAVPVLVLTSRLRAQGGDVGE